MRPPIFGRKKVDPPAPPPPSRQADSPGHHAVLANLRATDAAEPLKRLQVAGGVLCDFIYRMISNERGARIEDLIAILASTGGFSCIHSVLHAIANGSAERGAAGLVTVQTKSGQTYYFGDLPNRALIESQYSLLSLALGAARSCGGTVSLEMVQDVMRRVAGSVGESTFGVPDLPAEHMPGDLPINYAHYISPKIVEGLELYEVPVAGWPSALGFALQKAITAGKDTLNPTLAARITIECAVPMATLDPAGIAWPASKA